MLLLALIVSFFAAVQPLPPSSAATKESTPSMQLTITVKASPDSDMESILTLPPTAVGLGGDSEPERQAAGAIPLTDTYVTINGRTFLAGRDGNLYDEQTREKLMLRERTKKDLAQYIHHLRKTHYGRMLEWKQASRLMPKRAVLNIVDLETGLSFRAQKRAGKHHADVQPLTKEDTAIMKRIYNGKWSWKRKAVLVERDGQWLAASMHGMPHGGDGIPGNNFAGHFCIHFPGSTTHRSKNIDPEHQLMIRKAAGELDEYFADASASDVAEAFLHALHLNDQQIMKRCFAQADHRQLDYFLKEQVTSVRIRDTEMKKNVEDGLLLRKIPIEVDIARGGRGEQRETFVFYMKRISPFGAWKIDFIEKGK